MDPRLQASPVVARLQRAIVGMDAHDVSTASDAWLASAREITAVREAMTSAAAEVRDGFGAESELGKRAFAAFSDAAARLEVHEVRLAAAGTGLAGVRESMVEAEREARQLSDIGHVVPFEVPGVHPTHEVVGLPGFQPEAELLARQARSSGGSRLVAVETHGDAEDRAHRALAKLDASQEEAIRALSDIEPPVQEEKPRPVVEEEPTVDPRSPRPTGGLSGGLAAAGLLAAPGVRGLTAALSRGGGSLGKSAPIGSTSRTGGPGTLGGGGARGGGGVAGAPVTRGGGGRAGGRVGRGGRQHDQVVKRDLFDDGEDWLDDEGSGPGVLD